MQIKVHHSPIDLALRAKSPWAQKFWRCSGHSGTCAGHVTTPSRWTTPGCNHFLPPPANPDCNFGTLWLRTVKTDRRGLSVRPEGLTQPKDPPAPKNSHAVVLPCPFLRDPPPPPPPPLADLVAGFGGGEQLVKGSHAGLCSTHELTATWFKLSAFSDGLLASVTIRYELYHEYNRTTW